MPSLTTQQPFQVFSFLSPASHPTFPTAPNAKLSALRRSHRKSRKGCSACKSKRVKCDEAWPECGRCSRLAKCGEKASGCVYEEDTKLVRRKRSDGERRRDSGRESMSTASPEEVEEVEEVGRAMVRAVSVGRRPSMDCSEEEWNGMIMSSPSSLLRSLSCCPEDQELLHHYDVMTSEGLLIGPESTHYHTNMLRLAQKHTYLRHALLSTAALHLSHTTTSPTLHTTQHLHHLTRTLSSFQSAISTPVLPRSTSDALVLTSILISIQYFSLSTSSSPLPQDSWVYSTSPTRLSWLSIQLGTSALLGQFRPYHCEGRMLQGFSPRKLPPFPRPTSSSNRTLPSTFFALCEVSETTQSTHDPPGTHPNPYHEPLHALSRLLPIAPSLKKYLHFTSRMYAPFIHLIEKNDHRALLILAWYFALICGMEGGAGEMWWCKGRVRRDCWAICEVLDREGGEDVRELLEFPMGACGFAEESKDWNQGQ